LLQTLVAPQTSPQLPQLVGSLPRWVQRLLQAVRPPMQGRQLPPSQKFVVPHELPQPPQLLGSVCSLVHAVPQRAWPDEQPPLELLELELLELELELLELELLELELLELEPLELELPELELLEDPASVVLAVEEDDFPVEAPEDPVPAWELVDDDPAPVELPDDEDVEVPDDVEAVALPELDPEGSHSPATQLQPLGQKPPSPHALPVTSTTAAGLQLARARLTAPSGPQAFN
jgi:hypothetical protein